MLKAAPVPRLLRAFFFAALLLVLSTAFAYAADAESNTPAAESAQGTEGSFMPTGESPATSPDNASPCETEALPPDGKNPNAADALSTDSANTDDSPNADMPARDIANEAGCEPTQNALTGTSEQSVEPTTGADASSAEVAGNTGSQASTAIDEATSETNPDTVTEESKAQATPDTAAEDSADETAPADTTTVIPALPQGKLKSEAGTKAANSTAKASSASKGASAAKKASKRTISAKKYKKLLKVLTLGIKKHASKINLSKLRLYKKDMNTVSRAYWEVLYERHPEFFYVRGGYQYWWNGSKIVYKLKPKYVYNKKKTKSLKRKYNKSMKQLMSWVPKNGSTAQKAKAVHDWLIRNCSYNQTAVNNKAKWIKSKKKYYPWTALGAMVYRKPVCQGYVLAFQDAMNRLKIKSVAVESDTHAWNRIKVGKKWYTIDVTSDDDGGQDAIPSTTIFLKSDTYLKNNYSHWEEYWKWKPKGGYAPSGSKASGTTYDNIDTLSWKIYGPKINVISADCNVYSAVETNGVITQEPRILVFMSNNYKTFTLVEGRDYTVTFNYNMTSRTGWAIVAGKGNFKGTQMVSFDII